MSIRSQGRAAGCALGAFAFGSILGCAVDDRQVGLAGAGGTDAALGSDPSGTELDASRAGTGGGAGSGGTAAGGSAATPAPPEPQTTPELGTPAAGQQPSGEQPSERQPPMRVASAQTSRIRVSSDSVVAGATVTLTLQVNDAAGQPLGKGGDTVLFSVTGSDAEGAMGPVTDRGDGTYSAPFTAARSGALLAVAATLNGSDVGGEHPNVRVEPFSQQALDLDGASEFVSVGDLRQAEGTLSFWFNTTATQADLISKSVASDVAGNQFSVYLIFGQLQLRLEGTTIGLSQVNDGLWHHVLTTFGTQVTVFLDGRQRLSIAGTGAGLAAPGTTLEFGRNNDLKNGYYAGLLDEVALYQGLLRTDQALEIYGRGEPNDLKRLSSAGNLLHWWRLGELDQPPSATDSAGATPATLVGIGAENFVPVVR